MDTDELVRLLDELEGRLEGPAEALFELAVRQVWVDLLAFSLLFFSALVVWLVGDAWMWRIAKRQMARNMEHYHEAEFILTDIALPLLLWLIVGGIVVCGLGLLWLAALLDALNPEYAALRDIMGMLP